MPDNASKKELIKKGILTVLRFIPKFLYSDYPIFDDSGPEGFLYNVFSKHRYHVDDILHSIPELKKEPSEKTINILAAKYHNNAHLRYWAGQLVNRGLIRESTDLTEGIEVHGEELLVYAAVVAEEYEKAPRFDPRAIEGYMALAKSNERLLKQAQGKVDIEFTPEDPYPSRKKMLADMEKNKRLKIYTGLDEPHPAMSQDENSVLRAVHDFFAHASPVMKDFIKGKKNLSHGFDYRGELSAYLVHARIAPKEAIPILFTEVVGQISYFVITKDYAPQKATILDGFDYIRLGKYTDQRLQARHDELLEQYRNGGMKVNVKNGIFITPENAPVKMIRGLQK